MALAALGAAAVLDVGSNAAQAAPSASPFAGSWSGTWSHPGVVGTFDWTISDAGQINGSFFSITNNWGGAVVGHVSEDGKLSFTGAAPNDEPSTGQSGYHHKGAAEIDDDGRLVFSANLAASPFSDGPLVAILERN
jgi:hypothetical protein